MISPTPTLIVEIIFFVSAVRNIDLLILRKILHNQVNRSNKTPKTSQNK
jgi:hypothetical protein